MSPFQLVGLATVGPDRRPPLESKVIEFCIDLENRTTAGLTSAKDHHCCREKHSSLHRELPMSLHHFGRLF